MKMKRFIYPTKSNILTKDYSEDSLYNTDNKRVFII